MLPTPGRFDAAGRADDPSHRDGSRTQARWLRPPSRLRPRMAPSGPTDRRARRQPERAADRVERIGDVPDLTGTVDRPALPLLGPQAIFNFNTSGGHGSLTGTPAIIEFTAPRWPPPANAPTGVTGSGLQLVHSPRCWRCSRWRRRRLCAGCGDALLPAPVPSSARSSRPGSGPLRT